MEITSEMIDQLKKFRPVPLWIGSIVDKIALDGLLKAHLVELGGYCSKQPGGTFQSEDCYRLTRDGQSLLDDLDELVRIEEQNG